MKRRPSYVSIFTVLVLLAAWFAISNHCVLGAGTPQTKTEQNGCPFHAKQPLPAKQKPSTDSPCCKILRAVLAQKVFSAKTFFIGWIEFRPEIRPPLPQITKAIVQLDTGPPGQNSFTELIWSMRSHAPPFVS